MKILNFFLSNNYIFVLSVIFIFLMNFSDYEKKKITNNSCKPIKKPMFQYEKCVYKKKISHSKIKRIIIFKI